MKAESGTPADLLCSIAFSKGPRKCQVMAAPVTMVLITARLERARFCLEQTLHH